MDEELQSPSSAANSKTLAQADEMDSYLDHLIVRFSPEEMEVGGGMAFMATYGHLLLQNLLDPPENLGDRDRMQSKWETSGLASTATLLLVIPQVIVWQVPHADSLALSGRVAQTPPLVFLFLHHLEVSEEWQRCWL